MGAGADVWCTCPGLEGVGVVDRSRVRWVPDEREVSLDVSRREVTSTREATVDVSVVMPAMSCFNVV